MLKKSFLSLLFCILFCCCNNEKSNEIVNGKLKITESYPRVYDSLILKLRTNENNSVKLRAAKFLLDEITEKGAFQPKHSLDEIFNYVDLERKRYEDSISNYTQQDITRNSVRAFRKKMKQIQDQGILLSDLEWIPDSIGVKPLDFLNNINIALEAYQNNPLKLCRSSEDFLNFVLPYRAGQEPYEPKKREELYKKYRWVQDTLKVKSIDYVVKKIYEHLRLMAVWGTDNPFLSTPSMSQIEKTRFASCNELSNYFINVLRSIGIPSGRDFAPRFGNWHKSEGHSWVFYLTKDGFKAINIGLDRFETLNNLYEISSLPKVYRESYKGFQDVTNLYKPSFDVNVGIIWNQDLVKGNTVYLTVFDKFKGYDKIQKSNTRDGLVSTFKNLGCDIIYFPMVETDDNLNPVNYPFKITKNGVKHFYAPEKSVLSKAYVERKFTPFLVRDRKEKQRRAKSLNGCVLQGSDSYLTEFVNLDTINGFNSTRPISNTLKKKYCYKFFRLLCPSGKLVSISEFRLINGKQQIINNWDYVNLKNDMINDYKRVSDSLPLTFVDKKDFEMTYGFKKPICIYGYQVQARNDDNNIKIGDTYELLHWNKNWVSHKTMVAKDTVLEFRDIPKNSLFWLKNLSSGQEEMIFTFDEFGRQFWIGSSEYQYDNSMMLDDSGNLN